MKIPIEDLISMLSRSAHRWATEVNTGFMNPHYIAYDITMVHTVGGKAIDGNRVYDTPSFRDNNNFLSTSLRVKDQEGDKSLPGYDGAARIVYPAKLVAVQRMLHKKTDRFIKQCMPGAGKLRGMSVGVERSAEKLWVWPDLPVYTHRDTMASISLSPKQLCSLAEKVTAYILEKGEDIYQTDMALKLDLVNRVFTNSVGTNIFTSEISGKYLIDVDFKVDGRMKNVCIPYHTRNQDDLIDEDKIFALADLVLAEIEELRESKQESAGLRMVILGNGSLGTFLHEACVAHLLSADYIQSELSGTYADHLGRLVSFPGVTMVNDPTIALDDIKDKRGFSSYRFDQQGIPPKALTLIENGTLVSYLDSVESATLRGTPLSGSCRGSYTCEANPEPRIGTLVIKVVPEYQASSEELVRKAFVLAQKIPTIPDDYIIYCEVNAGHVDVSNSQFTITPNKAHRVYPDGRRERIDDFDLIGNSHRVLNGGIFYATPEEKVSSGYCSASSGSIPVTDISPKEALIGVMSVNQTQRPPKLTNSLIPLE